MKTLFRNTLVKPGAVLALAMAGLLSGGAAQAAGTAAGTDISNLATLNYSVGSTAQSPIGSSATGNTSGAGTGTSFRVDNKVSLLVTRDTSTFVSVVPGTNGVTSFTVNNTGNSVQDYSLSVANLASGTLSGVTDNFDTSTCSTFVESSAVANGYQVGSDTATFIDELAADTSKTVYVVCPIVISRVNGDGAIVSLTATTRVGGVAGTQGAVLAQSTAANTEAVAGIGGIDVVFADIAGAATGDVARDGKHSAIDVFKVVTASLTVTKTVAPVCDPFNGSANQKNIPGSFVRYTISIANAAGADTATLTSITDVLDTANLALDLNLITGTGAPATASSCSTTSTSYTSAVGKGFMVTGPVARASFSSGPKYFTSASDVDGVEFASPNITADFAKLLPSTDGGYLAGHLKAGETVSVIFQVQIN